MSSRGTFTFLVAAAGRVATGVAVLLQRAGHKPVAVASRSPDSARRAAEWLGTAVVDLDTGPLPPADVALIGATDAAVEGVARRIATRVSPSTILWHLSGASGIAPLKFWSGQGNPVAALHPVQACPSVEAAVARLPGSAWGVTCSAEAESWAKEMIARDLEGVPVPVTEEMRPLWHAASVTTSNGIAALLAAGEVMLAQAGILGADGADQILGPLAAGTLANVRVAGGGAKALTGPILRGEVGTVQRHLDALAAAPEALQSYRAAARLIVAAAGDRLPATAGSQIRRLLEG